MHKVFSILLILFITPSQPINAQTAPIRVAIASSLLPVFKEIKVAFEATHDYKIKLIPGASGTLAHQIFNGAPYDVYISADSKYSSQLHKKGYLDSSPTALFEGQLAIWSDTEIKDWNSENQEQQLKELFLQAQTITIAQPTTAPYGAASLSFLKKTPSFKSIESKIVYGHNISAVNQFIITQNVNIAFTARSSVIYLKNRTAGYWYYIKNSSEKNLTHFFCRINSSSNIISAELLNFIHTKSIEAIFTKYNYQIIH